VSDVTALRLDDLFAQMAEASRAFLIAWRNAGQSPSTASARAHDRLMDAQNEIERITTEIASVFEEATT